VELMIVLRFRVVCLPDKTDQMMAALRDVVAPARAVEGVISFDIARDLTDPNAFIATEVFQDEAARERQESLPQVGAVMSLLPSSIISPPEVTVYRASEAVAVA
jgi:quinol monooxygenase YgiN